MNLNGIIVLNKPRGVSSSNVVLKVKKMLKARKVGHTGTLDPLATGVLPLCIDEATKLVPFFSQCEKEYVATLRLGIETDTQDSEGKIIRRTEAIPLDVNEISSAFDGFQGSVLQTPPMYSALKHKGIPLYRIARSGGWVERAPRKITIRGIDIVSCSLPFVTFRVRCSAGTYIRTLCADIGQKLACGAHMVELRRVRNGSFHINDAVQLEELQSVAHNGSVSTYMIPLKEALIDMPEVTADDLVMKKIAHGSYVSHSDVAQIAMPTMRSGQKAKIVSPCGRLVAVVEFLIDYEQTAVPSAPARLWKTVRTFLN